MIRYFTLLAYLAGLSLLLGLGFWQYSRGLEKSSIEMEWQDIKDNFLAVRSLNEINFDRYQTVQIKGRWDIDRQFLLENRIHQTQNGFEVFTPFTLQESGEVILVNRGWVNKTDIDGIFSNLVPHEESLRGVIYKPEKGFTLGDSILQRSDWPQKFQYFDASALSESYGSEIPEMVLVLDKNHAAVFTPIWSPTVVTASRHYGYAVQWWGLAVVMLVFGFIWKNQKPANR